MTHTVVVAPPDSLEAQCATRALGETGVLATTATDSAADVTLVFATPDTLVTAAWPAPADGSALLLVCPRADLPARQLATELGAKGLIGWQSPTTDVVAAIEQVSRGVSRLPTPEAQEDPLELLTQREIEIVSLLREGASNDAIAHALGISYHTVRTHVAHVLAKLGVSHRYAVVALACHSPRLTLPIDVPREVAVR